jgi:hypothetical protein
LKFKIKLRLWPARAAHHLVLRVIPRALSNLLADRAKGLLRFNLSESPEVTEFSIAFSRALGLSEWLAGLAGWDGGASFPPIIGMYLFSKG